MWRICVAFVALALALAGRWIWASLRGGEVPEAGIVTIGYAMPTGVPVFTITNATTTTILRSPRCWIHQDERELPTNPRAE